MLAFKMDSDTVEIIADSNGDKPDTLVSIDLDTVDRGLALDAFIHEVQIASEASHEHFQSFLCGIAVAARLLSK